MTFQHRLFRGEVDWLRLERQDTAESELRHSRDHGLCSDEASFTHTHALTSLRLPMSESCKVVVVVVVCAIRTGKVEVCRKRVRIRCGILIRASLRLRLLRLLRRRLTLSGRPRLETSRLFVAVFLLIRDRHFSPALSLSRFHAKSFASKPTQVTLARSLWSPVHAPACSHSVSPCRRCKLRKRAALFDPHQRSNQLP